MKQSAGIVVYRKSEGRIEVLLVHPGGPFWARKDNGAWSIPKGEFTAEESALDAAKREFGEEIGQQVPEGQFISLGEHNDSGKKRLCMWAVEGDIDATHIQSNIVSIEWPPKSGTLQDFPECDRAEWFPLAVAKQKLFKGQVLFIDRLAERLGEVVVAPEPVPSEEDNQTSLF